MSSSVRSSGSRRPSRFPPTVLTRISGFARPPGLLNRRKSLIRRRAREISPVVYAPRGGSDFDPLSPLKPPYHRPPPTA